MRESLRKSYLRGVFWVLAVVLILPSSGQSYLHNYDPQKGFGKADKSLTTIFLKIAGSLEHHGSPEPYLKWILEKEHPRIAAKWEDATGIERTSRPNYLTDDYLEKLLAGWESLEKPLGLEKLCRESGRYMRFAIDGSWNKTPEDWAFEEPGLSQKQRGLYKKLLAKPFFTKADFKETESFYADGGGHEKLSKTGKAQLSDRFWLGKMPKNQRDNEFARRKGGTELVKFLNSFQERIQNNINTGGKRVVDADLMKKELANLLKLNGEKIKLVETDWTIRDSIAYSHLIKQGFDERFSHVDRTSSKEDAEWAEKMMGAMLDALRIAAYSEIDAAIYELVVDQKR